MSFASFDSAMESKYNIFLESARCRTCLSAGRVLRAVHNYADVFWRVVGPIDCDLSQLLICWECEALLRSVVRFQNKVHTANSALGVFGPTDQESLSKLGIIELQSISIDIKTKTEQNGSNIQNSTETFTDGIFNNSNKTPSENIKVEVEFVEIKKEKLEYQEPEQKEEEVENDTEEKPKKILKSAKRANTTSKYFVKVAGSTEDISNYSTVAMNETKLLEFLRIERESELFKESKYKCMYCVIGFESKDLMLQHMTRHEKSAGIYKCEVCQTRFRTQLLLTEHIKSHYEKLVCNACGFECYTKTRILLHYKENHVTDSYVCTKCGMKFVARSECVRHCRAAHACFECDYCGRRSTKKWCLIEHMKRRHWDIKCAECGELCVSLRELREHQQLTHEAGGATDAYCVECDKQFANDFSYQSHLKTAVKHAGPRTRRFACDACDKWFAVPSLLRKHRDSVHLKIKRHRCDDCGQMFGRKDSLHTHRVWKHAPPNRDRTCRVCEMPCSSKARLSLHMLIHTGERPYSCPHCPKSFNQTGALRKHVRRLHNMQPPPTDSTMFEPKSNLDSQRLGKLDKTCRVCEKLFSSMALLRRHMLIHTGERPFSCPHCPSTFNQGGAMRTHVRKVHNMEPPPPSSRRNQKQNKLVTADSTTSHGDCGYTDVTAQDVIEDSKLSLNLGLSQQ